jgi:7-cyano-7-deazaguanine synthase
MAKINNWSLGGHPTSPYQAPETNLRLHGVVTGHPNFPDGSEVTTSRIKEVRNGKVYTHTGSEYELGTVDPEYEKLYPNALHRLLSRAIQIESSIEGVKMNKGKALVVLSGGQDSTTCLAWAINEGYEVHTISFDYGQKHVVELHAALAVARILGVPASRQEFVPLGAGILAGTSPLVNKNAELEQYADHQSLPGGLEKTFVPMRNQLFLTVAANRAYVLGCSVLVTGVCQEDFGGYPDCRRVFIDALQDACNYGTFTGQGDTLPPLRILTPLMSLTKAASVHLAMKLPGCMSALAYSHTAYDGQYPPLGHDHATLLRAKGFEEAGIPDPLVLRAVGEGLMASPNTPNYTAESILHYLNNKA